MQAVPGARYEGYSDAADRSQGSGKTGLVVKALGWNSEEEVQPLRVLGQVISAASVPSPHLEDGDNV